MKNYVVPVKYSSLEKSDLEFERYTKQSFGEDIRHFERTAELLIALFSNAKRVKKPEEQDNIHLISVRIFQDSRAALKLVLSGLYPQAASLIRGTLESVLLIYDFKINPAHEKLWFSGGKNKRKELFKASAVRYRVKEAGVVDAKPSIELYDLLSDWSVHSNMESYLWYMETRNNKLFYHWAGFTDGNRTQALVLSTVSSLAQGLFVLADEGFYAFNKEFLRDYFEWKKEHLVFSKKMAKVFNDKDFLDIEFEPPKID